MPKSISKFDKSNLVFQGGGVLGIAYIGAIDYLSEIGIQQKIINVAGVSAGAITACVSSFNLPFVELRKISETLDYQKILEKNDFVEVGIFASPLRLEFENIFGDIQSLHRLVKNYGFYSTDYFYEWISNVINEQFDQAKKLPPYTFADFMNTSIHKGGREFKKLYLKGTNVSSKQSRLFSYDTTPNLEVAQAVKISMSVPLFFESTKTIIPEEKDDPLALEINAGKDVYCDGGIMANYPIGLFDDKTINYQTLGVRIASDPVYKKINNLLDFVMNLMDSLMSAQSDYINNNPIDKARSIEIKTASMAALNFNIKTGDETYNFLYQQGYNAAKAYFR